MEIVLAGAIIIIAIAVGVISHLTYKLSLLIHAQAKSMESVKLHINNFHTRLLKLEARGKPAEPTNLMFKNVRENQKKV